MQVKSPERKKAKSPERKQAKSPERMQAHSPERKQAMILKGSRQIKLKDMFNAYLHSLGMIIT